MKKITINAKTHIIKTRKLWYINPVERTVASKKSYSRTHQKRELKNSFSCEF